MIETHGGQDIYDNLNELIDDFSVTTNYLGPSKVGLECIKKNVTLINHYPKQDQEPYKTNLCNFLFKKIKNKNNHLILGNGASEFIELIIRTCVKTEYNKYTEEKPQPTYYVNPVQYMEYERACINNNAVKTTDIKNADIVCIVNPCNPTGEYLPLPKMLNLINSCKDNSTIIIDESMQIWLNENFRQDSMLSQYKFIKNKLKNNNIKIYIVHSWTKIFSCTGLRIGSVLTPDKNTYDTLLKHQNPWSCNILALEYLNATISDYAYLQKTWNTTYLLRKYQTTIIETTFPTWKTEGEIFLSWIWIKLPDENIAEKIYNVSKNNNMPVRWGKIGYNKPNYIRLAVRETKTFNLLINVWKRELFIYNKNIGEIKKIKMCDLKCHEQIYTDCGEKLYNYLLSLEEFKTIPVIIVDKNTNIIIDGHHRYYALSKLNITEIDVLFIDHNDENIIVNPENSKITKEDVIKAGQTDQLLEPKTTRYCIYINNELKPIISLSTIISI
jgi:histidinol-phosphate/aromatic aminotransferase/cobyric acid decarboxylase-like protein